MNEFYRPAPEEVAKPPELEEEPQEKVLHRERIGFREYVITGEAPEVMEKWHGQILEIIGALQNRDLDKLLELMQSGKYKLDLQKITEIIGQEIKDQEGLDLLGISLWILREKDKYAGNWKITKKMLKGGKYSLSEFLATGGEPWCLETTVLARALAENFGIKGEIKRAPIGHRYFRSNSGKIIDIWWGFRHAGVFQNDQQWKENKVIKEKHPCGKPEKLK